MKVFYRPEMSVADNASSSPSAGKPKLAVEDWMRRGFPIEIVSPEPLTIDQICVAHDHAYIENLLVKLTVSNGFGNKSSEIARSLLFVAGSVFQAANYSVTTEKPSWSPSSGSHHSHYDSGHGYCSINHILISAILLKKLGFVDRVAVLDQDCHFSDGDRDIMEKLKIDWISHFSFGEQGVTPRTVKRYLKSLPGVIRSIGKDADLIYHNAGVDSHAEDNLGGILTSKEMRERDRITYTEIKKLGIGSVTLLAGGYRRDTNGTIQPVLDSHAATMEECLVALEGWEKQK